MPSPPPPKETQFQPGQSGNPAGYSRGRRLGDRLVRLFDEMALDEPFLKAGIKEALSGNFPFWREIFQRIDGKVPDPQPDTDDLPEPTATDENGEPVEP